MRFRKTRCGLVLQLRFDQNRHMSTKPVSSSPRPASPRVQPKAADTDELREIFAKALGSPTGKPLNIFGTLAHHPKLLKRFNVLGGFFLNSGLLPDREREVVILRVGHNCQAEYEFGQHTVIGKRVGLTDREISALAVADSTDSGTHTWNDTDAALIALADDLCTDNCVSDPTWAAIRQRWNEAEAMELVMVAGFYRMVSGFLNTMGVELDEGVPGWP
jgi:4-carboxymuconolactone decarboxylase